jgi:hypothetical protein
VPGTGRHDSSDTGARGLGAGIGFVPSYLLVFGLAHLVPPDAMEGFELPYGAIVGVAIGTIPAAAIGARVADRAVPS